MTASSTQLAVSIVVAVAKCAGVAALLLVARGVCWLVNMLFIAPRSDPLRHLPGPDAPKGGSHLNQVLNPTLTPDTHRDWVAKYGKTFKFHGFGGHDLRLMSFDQSVYTHVLNSPIYEKPWQTRSMLARLLGAGITTMEGHRHKVQRRIISPAFSTAAIRAMSPVFFGKAIELRDEWFSLLSESESDDESATVDSMSWLTRAAFDVIGLCAFDYNFGALASESGEDLGKDQDEVYLAYRHLFKVIDKGFTPSGLIRLYFPFLNNIFPDENEKVIRRTHATIREAGRRGIQNKKAAILSEGGDSSDKDLLTILLRSNMSNDVEPSARLSDSEVLDQITSILFGGADSPSITVALCLQMLAENSDAQDCLRAEVQKAFASTPITEQTTKRREGTPDSGYAEDFTPSPRGSFAEVESPDQALESVNLDQLQYLDGVVRETLRLHPPIHSTIRVATQDDIIPTSQEIPGSLGKSGVHIRKGSYIHIPIEGLNYDESIWGEDSRQFKPERWLSSKRASLPGLHNLMTFSMGPHSCPGTKFTTREVKAFLAVLIANFKFEPAPEVKVKKFNQILTRPYVEGKFDTPNHGGLPLRVTRLNVDSDSEE